MRLVRLVEAVLKAFLRAGAGFLRVVHAADDKGHLDRRQLALQHRQPGCLGVRMQLPADFANLHLPGSQLRQARSLLGNQHILHFLPEGGTAVVVGVARVEDAHINGAALKLPGAHAGRVFVGRNASIVGVAAGRIVLRLGVHKHIALLRPCKEVHQRIGRFQVELHRSVIQRFDVGQQLRLVLAEQPAEQAGVGGDGVLADDERRAVRHIVRREQRTVVELNIVAQLESPHRAVLIGFPAGGQARHQRAVKAVGMHQRVGERTNLRVGRSSGSQPAAHQLLHRRDGGDAQPPANGFGFLRRSGRVRRAGSGGGDDRRRNGGRRSGSGRVRRRGARLGSGRRRLRRGRRRCRRRGRRLFAGPATGHGRGQQQRHCRRDDSRLDQFNNLREIKFVPGNIVSSR